MKSACLFLAILFLLGACVPSPLTPVPVSPTPPLPASPDTSTPTPTAGVIPSETFTLIPPATIQPPTDTPTATTVIQVSDTPTLACDHDTATLVLSTNAQNPKVGDAVQVTVTLNNEGCVALGLPQYRLYIASDGSQPILTPAAPEPVVHYLAVNPGQTDSAEFTLTAAASGQAKLTATVSYEVHLGYPGPAYWGSAATGEPLVLSVAP